MSNKPEFEVRADIKKRTVVTRMTGLFSEEDMRAWAALYRREGTDAFRGLKHMVIADMRGMKTVRPAIASILGETIGHARRNGVVLCAHLSDDSVQKLQAKRVARQNSPDDDVTVDVSTPEEAQKVLDEARPRIDDKSSSTSIRAEIV